MYIRIEAILKNVFIVCFLFCFLGSGAQKIEIEYTGDSMFYTLDSAVYDFPVNGMDSVFIAAEIQLVIESLRSSGYLAANLDHIGLINDSILAAQVYVGSQLVYGKLDWDGIDKTYFEDARIRGIQFEKGSVSKENVSFVLSIIREQLDNSGYPLSRIYFENQYVRNDSFFAEIKIDKGKLIRLSELEIKPDSIISPLFLQRFLDINPKSVFSLNKIQEIPRQINTLPYLSMKAAPQVKIFDDKAILELPISKRNASRFDFLIGVLPNVENEDRLTISGEITADLKNKFKQGEELYFYFRQLKPETQRMDIRIKYPYLLNLPFGLHTNFALYRNGQESRDLNAEIGIEYRVSPYATNIFYGSFQSSRLIGIDTIALITSRRLPSSLDVALNNIGYTYELDRRDYRFNPRKGLQTRIGLTGGIKNIIKNSRITDLKTQDVDFSAAYDTIPLRAIQLSGVIDIAYFIPLGKSATFKLGNMSGGKYNPSQVFNNELYRIGGSNVLRGFDEESIRAQYYSIFTAEYRYLLGLNSYFSTFIDYGITYNELRTTGALDFPLGFGVGLSFQTAAGIFGIDVALGREQRNPIDFRNTKTHFGFVSLF